MKKSSWRKKNRNQTDINGGQKNPTNSEPIFLSGMYPVPQLDLKAYFYIAKYHAPYEFSGKNGDIDMIYKNVYRALNCIILGRKKNGERKHKTCIYKSNFTDLMPANRYVISHYTYVLRGCYYAHMSICLCHISVEVFLLLFIFMGPDVYVDDKSIGNFD